MITIFKPQVEVIDNYKVKLKCRIVDEAQNLDKELWYEVDKEYAKYLCPEVCDGFIIAMLLPAIKFRQKIVVKAPMSASLYHNMVNVVIPLIGKLYGFNYDINETNNFLKISQIINPEYNPFSVATGCSMGVDSLTAIKSYLKLSENCSYIY